MMYSDIVLSPTYIYVCVLTYEDTSPISSGVHGPNRTTAVAPDMVR